MTNGEKIKAIFPSMEVGFMTDSQIGIYFVKNQHNATVFSLDWWNAEYKESTTKNNLVVDCISRQGTIDAIRRIHPIDNVYDCTLFDKVDVMYVLNDMPSVTPIRPKGHWIMTHDYFTGAYESIDYVRCSCCHEDSLEEGNYCPNCGAEMSEVEE